MSHCEVSEFRNAITGLTSEMKRATQAAYALLKKFEALDGLAFAEFDQSLLMTSGWATLADAIGAAGLQIHDQALHLKRIGTCLLEPFDTARQLQMEAETDAVERANRVTEYARAETDTKIEADALRQRLREGEKLSASERSRAQGLGVLLPPTEEFATSHR
jgi:hypothetical protein